MTQTIIIGLHCKTPLSSCGVYPLVKAGGMRVAQHRPPKADGGAAPAEPEVEEESTEQQVVEQPKPGAVFISGVEAKVGVPSNQQW